MKNGDTTVTDHFPMGKIEEKKIKKDAMQHWQEIDQSLFTPSRGIKICVTFYYP